MATIKSYTDIEQSEKLAELLPLESADQTWVRTAIFDASFDVPEGLEYIHNGDEPFQYYSGIGIPCWSLSALLDTLKDFNPDIMFLRSTTDCHGARLTNVWRLSVNIYTDNYAYLEIIIKDNPIDACNEMIIKLHELKML